MTMSDMSPDRSDQIGETLFHLAELANADPQEKAGDSKTETEARPIEAALAAEQAPAEAVDDADHGVERIEKTPLVRHDGGTEAHRRHIKAKLHDEWNDVAEIPIFDVEGRDPEADAQARRESNGREHRQQQNL